MIPLPHQQDCLDRLRAVRKQGRERALIVVATGLGKTVISAFDVRRFRTLKPGSRMLYLCHQKDILRQARRTFELVLGEEATCGYFHGMEKHFHDVDCLFASFQSMREWREVFLPDEFDYIVVDESHHGSAPTYRPTIEYFESKFLLGITATPDRTDLQDIREIYGREVYSLPIEEALAKGLLTRVDYRLITDELVDLKVLETPLGKLSITELNKRLFVPKRDEEIALIIQKRIKKIKDPRVMIFCPSVDYCIRLSALLPEATPVHYRLSGKDQEIRLELFRQGRIRSVLTVDKFNEGIDIPEANVIVFLRSTTSRMLFLQQLGRGLRKVEGKKKVLVLDFVGNCERLEMVHHLWSEVMTYHSHKISGNGPMPIEIDVGRLKFSEVTKNVLDVIMAVRGGYTKEMLIKQLRQLADELGRTPGTRDIEARSRLGLCASSKTFWNFFGSYNEAVKAAGLDINPESPHYTKGELIQQLRELGATLNRRPTCEDVRKASRARVCASPTAFVRHFGTFTAACEEAGLPYVRERLALADLIQQLQSLTRELGRTPNSLDINTASKAGKCANTSTYAKRFGSFNKALEAAGLPLSLRFYSTEELLEQLENLVNRFGRRPTCRDIEEASRTGFCASPSVFATRFGSHKAALLAAGIRWNIITKDVLIEQLQALAKELGRTPRVKDVQEANKSGKCAGPMAIIRRFGTYNKAIRAAGLQPNIERR